MYPFTVFTLMSLLSNLSILSSVEENSEWVKDVSQKYLLSEDSMSQSGILEFSFSPTNIESNGSMYLFSLLEFAESEVHGNLTCAAYFDTFRLGRLQRTSSDKVRFTHVLPGLFCLRVRPATLTEGGTCKTECQWQMIRSFPDRSMPQESCQVWSGILSARSSQFIITVNFTVFPIFKQCFKSYNIILLNTLTGLCTLWGGNLTLVETKKGVASGKVVKFEGLQPGNYCVHVKAVSPYLSGLRRIHRFVRVYFPAVVHANETAILPFESRRRTMAIGFSWVYAVIGLIIFMSLALSTWIFCFKRHHFGKRTAVIKTVELKPLQSPVVMKAKLKCVKVLLIYFHESEKFEEVIDLFVKILRECWKIEVIVDKDEEHMIFVNNYGWILNKLSSFWNSPDEDNCIRKVLVIESEQCVQWAKAWEECLDPNINDDGNILNEVCKYGLMVVAHNPNSLSAYGKLIVARFEFTPDGDYLKNLVPNKRFRIPSHLTDLYRELHYANYSYLVMQSGVLPSEAEWKNSRNYQELEKLIQEHKSIEFSGGIQV